MQHLGVFIVSVSGVSGLVGPGWKLGRAPVVRRDDGSSCVRSVEASGLDVDMSVPLSSFAACQLIVTTSAVSGTPDTATDSV